MGPVAVTSMRDVCGYETLSNTHHTQQRSPGRQIFLFCQFQTFNVCEEYAHQVDDIGGRPRSEETAKFL